MIKLRYILLLGLLVILSISIGYASPSQQHTIPQTIRVTMYVLNPSNGDIAKNNPVCTKGSLDYGCGYKDPNNDVTKDRSYEYDSHIIDVNLEEDYLPSVLVKELGGTTPKQYEALKAQAIASRSYALHFNDVQKSELSNSKNHQVFAPKSELPTPVEIQAVNDTKGQILLCSEYPYCLKGREDTPIFAEFSLDHGCRGEKCNEGDTRTIPHDKTLSSPQAQHPYLVGIWDPIRNVVNQGGHGHGMDHNAAKLWATGDIIGNNYYPAWDYRRILAHYYTGIEFQGINKPIPPQSPEPGYRFNLLSFTGVDSEQKVQLKAGVEYSIDFEAVLQNTGTLPWNLGDIDDVNECGSTKHNIALSYHIYDDANQTELYREGVRTTICGEKGSHLLPGQHLMLKNIGVKLPFDDGLPRPSTPTCYTFRWDVELAQNHDKSPLWISRLDTSDYEWPTQDIKFCYNPSSPPPTPQPTATPPKQNSLPAKDLDNSTSETGWRNESQLQLTWNVGSLDNAPTLYYSYQGPGALLQPQGQESLGWQTNQSGQAVFTTLFLQNPQIGFHELCLYYDFEAWLQKGEATCYHYQVDPIPPAFRLISFDYWQDALPILQWQWADAESGPDKVKLYRITPNGDYDIATLSAPQTDYDLATANLALERGQEYHFYLMAYDHAGNTTRQNFNFYYRAATPRLAVNTTQLSQFISINGGALSLSLLNTGQGTVAWDVVQWPGNSFVVPTDKGTFNQSSSLTVYVGNGIDSLPIGIQTGRLILQQRGTNCTVAVDIKAQIVDPLKQTYLPLIMGNLPTQPHFVTCTEGLVPQTRLLISGTLSSSQEWYRTPLTFTFITTPPLSVTTFYRFTTPQTVTARQAITWLQYHQPFTFNLEGNRAIHYYSQDNLGHIEPVQTATFKIDLTTPIVEINAERLSRCDAQLGYTIRDLVSGLHDVVVTVDGVPVDEDFNLMYLELGDHTVAITGTDYADWVTTFVQHIPLPADVGGIICTKHILFDLGEIFGPGAQGIVNSLDAKLEAAQRAIERGQTHTAINQLNAFINEVEAQQANHIKLAGAERMIADARAVIAILEAGN